MASPHTVSYRAPVRITWEASSFPLPGVLELECVRVIFTIWVNVGLDVGEIPHRLVAVYGRLEGDLGLFGPLPFDYAT
ncbi:uncharacterized protein J3R85_016671 [Psidium guajava]|nr:uncharacterized protein J3R85_016671 [Psidium guajava]